jgi:hypothetical protein
MAKVDLTNREIHDTLVALDCEILARVEANHGDETTGLSAPVPGMKRARTKLRGALSTNQEDGDRHGG